MNSTHSKYSFKLRVYFINTFIEFTHQNVTNGITEQIKLKCK